MVPSASALLAGSSAASGSSAPKELTYPLPPTTLQSVEKKLAQKQPAPPAPNAAPTEQVIVPPRGTLASGKYEARPRTIWLVVVVALLLVLLWALGRVRRARVEQKKKLDALTTLKKPVP